MKRILYAILLLAALAGCGRQPQTDGASESVNVYSASHIREVARTDYQQAMSLAEKGLKTGVLSAYDANYLRAQITYNYTENYAEAAEYVRLALEQEEANDPAVRVKLYYRLVTIYRGGKDYSSLLSVCAEGKETAHKAGLVFEENAFDFMAGNCLYDIGEDDTGYEMMTSSLRRASEIAITEEEFGHLCYFCGNLVNDYIESKFFEKALAQCEEYEKTVNKMTAKFPEANDEFIDMSLFNINMNRAICYQRLGKVDSATSCFETASSFDYANTSGAKAKIVTYYAAAGQPDIILKIYNEEIPYACEDTVSRIYMMRLARLREAYTNAGDTAKADEYSARYDALGRQIEEKERAEGTLTKAAEYDVKRYRLMLGDAATSLVRHKMTLYIVLCLILIAIVVFMILNKRYTRNWEIQRKAETDALEKDLQQLRHQVSVIAESNHPKEPERKSGESLAELIEGNRLYLNKNLNRVSTASLLGISQADITRMLGEIEPGLSFPDYIKGLRVRHAKSLLAENPDITIADLADRCGFYTVRTLQRSFLSVTGKTPSEYAKELKRQSSI